jgi:hypothetical protein
MPLIKSSGIHRKIATMLLVLIVAGAGRQAAAQYPGQGTILPMPGQPQMPNPGPNAAQAAANDAAEKAWAKIGPPIKKVDYDNLPLAEILRPLQNSFSNQFDIIADRDVAPGIAISLRLQDVSASEVFNAMNLFFETDNSSQNRKPHWKLILNGSRPTAVLEVKGPDHNEPARQSSVFYIGDLLGNGGPGIAGGVGFSPQDLFKAIREVHDDANGDNLQPHLSFHPEAGLLVVTGTQTQINLTQQTLNALQQKVSHDRTANLPRPMMPLPSPPPPVGARPPMQQPGLNPGTN